MDECCNTVVTKTPVRTFRIPDEVWIAAKAKADREGRTMTDVVLELLTDWVGQ